MRRARSAFTLSLLALAATTAGCAATPSAATPSAPAAPAPRNLILMIADGFGPASATLAREVAGRPLALDAHLVGAISTFAADTLVTDSAASATALASGVKTNNGMVGELPDGTAVRTVLEEAEAHGLATGLVTTSRLSHATPACFAAHVPSRGMEQEIAAQMLAQGIEVLLGGGRATFLPRGDGGLRGDGRDLLAEAGAAGYQVVVDPAGLAAAGPGRVLGLFNDSHMEFEIDRDAQAEPSLAAMTARALELLADDPDGFLLVVEGARIDHAAHANDAVSHLSDILAYDAAFAVAAAFAAESGDTLLVSTADHETGGLTLGRSIGHEAFYEWRPEVLTGFRASPSAVARAAEADGEATRVLRELAGDPDLTDGERAELDTAAADGKTARFYNVLVPAVDRLARVAWTTTGHTGVDVLVYALGPGAERFRGHRDNTEIGRTVADLFGFELSAP